MLPFLDQAFFFLHAVLILFNMLGWIWRATRPYQAVTLGLTAFSWFILGCWYGWGYCLCTDWHFMIRRQIGIDDGDTSYIQLLVDRLCGLSLDRSQADTLAGGVFLVVLVCTAAAWILDRRSAKQEE